MVYLAWKHGGHDPFRFYNRLDETGYPAGASELDRWLDGPVLPPDPRRIQNVLAAFALHARLEQVELAGGAGVGVPPQGS